MGGPAPCDPASVCAATGLVKPDAAWMEELVGWNPDTLRKQNPTGTHHKLIIIRQIIRRAVRNPRHMYSWRPVSLLNSSVEDP